MFKRTIVLNTNSVNMNQNSSFIQAKNKLIASSKTHVRNKNGIVKSNILSVISENNFIHQQQNKKVSLFSNSRKSIGISTESNVSTADANIQIQSVYKVDIFTVGATSEIAKGLANILLNCGIHTNLFIRHINNADIEACNKGVGRYIFILSPQVFLNGLQKLNPLPSNKYFLFQLANLSQNRLNPQIIDLIKNSKLTFDCSLKNMPYYPRELLIKINPLLPPTLSLSTDTNIQVKKVINVKMLYPSLFHKYVLGLRNPDDNGITNNYSLVKESSITRKNICHIHCFYLKSLSSMFGIYISDIYKTFDIIVTYTHQDDTVLNKYGNITFLRVINYGMDIGPKFTVYEFLQSRNIDYNYVFYIHSKSDSDKRNKYLMPFIRNLRSIDSALNENNSIISCYFNSVIWYGDGRHVKNINKTDWSYNKIYMNDILNYLQIKRCKNNTMFEEGNFYILHKSIIDKLFSDKLLYNILNTGNSFDYNWVKIRYGISSNNIYEVYQIFKQNRFFGNNVATNKGHNALADAMIEHVFERLTITMCKEYDISVNILDNISTKTIFVGNKRQSIQGHVQRQVQTQVQAQAQIILPEQIIHTQLKTVDKTLCIVACHTSSELKIKYLKHNKKYFEEIANDIVYINSTEFKELNVIDNMVYTYNDSTVCYGKYLHVLLNMDISKYDNVILTNDSFLITKSLTGFKSLFIEPIEMTSLIASNQINKHYPDFLRRYNKVGILKIIYFYKTRLTKDYSFADIIREIEVKSHLIHNNSINVVYDSIPGYNENIHFDNVKLKDYLYNKNYPIIKIKKLQFTTYNNRQLPSDFNPNEYKSLNPDLSTFGNDDVTKHFLKHGMSEGRIYKKNQQLIYPNFLTQYLNQINM